MKHKKIELEFIPRLERLPVIVGEVCLCYTPLTDKPYRLISSDFVRLATDVTHWALIPDIIDEEMI